MSMSHDEAQALRTARGTDATLLSRKPKHELAAIFRSETGTISPVNRYSKDELVGGILEVRYPLARENEAIHVLHHDDTWPDCPHCQAEEVADLRASVEVGEPVVFVPTGTGWPVTYRGSHFYDIDGNLHQKAAPDDPPEYDPDDAEAQRIAEVFADARAEQDRGL